MIDSMKIRVSLGAERFVQGCAYPSAAYDSSSSLRFLPLHPLQRPGVLQLLEQLQVVITRHITWLTPASRIRRCRNSPMVIVKLSPVEPAAERPAVTVTCLSLQSQVFPLFTQAGNPSIAKDVLAFVSQGRAHERSNTGAIEAVDTQ